MTPIAAGKAFMAIFAPKKAVIQQLFWFFTFLSQPPGFAKGLPKLECPIHRDADILIGAKTPCLGIPPTICVAEW